MNLSEQLAKHFRDVHFGGNWTAVNLKDTLKDVTWQQAIAEPGPSLSSATLSFNTVATLVFHTNYFVVAMLDVLQGKPLNAHDKFSFDHPPIQSQIDWENFVANVFADAETCAALIAQLPESKLWDDFSENKYGNYYRNIQGIVEHMHYHLGQIVLIKKWLTQDDEK